jgi:hypothetical protein
LFVFEESESKTSVLIGALVGAGAFILLSAFILWIWLRTRARKYRHDYDDPQGPIFGEHIPVICQKELLCVYGLILRTQL